MNSEVKKDEEKRLFVYVGFNIIPLFMVFIVKSQHLLFGNSIDWFNQHVTLADALRHAIRSEGTIFPTYLSNLMSGVNIYHFSYYGTLRSDVLLGALLIHVKMVNIIIFYQVFSNDFNTDCLLFIFKKSS